jgi:TLC ATP/ADP transporter
VFENQMSLRQRKKFQPEAAAAAAIDTRGGDDVAVAPSSAADSKNSKGGGGGGGSALTRLRETIFPIYGKEEVTKFLLMGSIKFFIILALTLTRDTKDTLVVTQCGAEAIAFLKVRTCPLSVCEM